MEVCVFLLSLYCRCRYALVDATFLLSLYSPYHRLLPPQPPPTPQLILELVGRLDMSLIVSYATSSGDGVAILIALNSSVVRPNSRHIESLGPFGRESP